LAAEKEEIKGRVEPAAEVKDAAGTGEADQKGAAKDVVRVDQEAREESGASIVRRQRRCLK
jgi:hypothetical protein